MSKTGVMSGTAYFTLLLILGVPGLATGQQTAEAGKPAAGIAQKDAPIQPSSKPPESGPSRTAHRARPDYDRVRIALFAAKPVTVEQLGEMIGEAHGSRDAEVAKKLSDMALTQRLSGAKLMSWESSLPGRRSRQALTALADASAFLDPPATQMPALPPPGLSEQQHILSLTIDYLRVTIPKLPNFFAKRITTRYEDQKPDGSRMANRGAQAWRAIGSSSETVLYRDGAEVVDSRSAQRRKSKAVEGELVISGTFGPILFTVIVDAAHGQTYWSHWEQGADGPEAVFRYVVPEKESHYEVEYLSLSGEGEKVILRQRTGYHGEVAVDPASGIILRLALQADLASSLPLVRSDIMVAYGPVELGGKTYICPLRSVGISRGWTLLLDENQSNGSFGSEVTILNDVGFGGYHLFRSESRILTGDTPVPEGR